MFGSKVMISMLRVTEGEKCNGTSSHTQMRIIGQTHGGKHNITK